MALPLDDPGGPREAAVDKLAGAFTFVFCVAVFVCPCVEGGESADVELLSAEKTEAADDVEDFRRLESGWDEETETSSICSLNDPVFCFLSFFAGVSMLDGEGGLFPFPFESFFLDFAFWEEDIKTSSGKST